MLKNNDKSKKKCLHPLFVAGFLILALQIFVLRQQFTSGGPSMDAPTAQLADLPSFSSFNKHQTTTSTKTQSRVPDGTFNGYPVYLHDNANTGGDNTTPALYSQVHCVGETYGIPIKNSKIETSWMYRSCRFSLLCFDTERKDFVVFQDPDEKTIAPTLKERSFLDVSTMLENSSKPLGVAIGGINSKWTFGETGAQRMRWFPRIETSSSLPSTFYTLPAHVVMVPFHSLNGFNPGHLLWDDFLPLFSLLHIFQMDTHEWEPLWMRYQLEPAMWASCDFRAERREACLKMFQKFGPLMLRKSPKQKITTQLESYVDLNSTKRTFASSPKPKSNLVCAKQGLAGLGPLTDHGIEKGHGWDQKDYLTTHNMGRGGLLWQFRQYTMRNLGIEQNTYPTSRPFKIVFSVQSSSSRSINFDDEIALLKKELDPKQAVVQVYKFSAHSLEEQVEVASQAAIYISACGGGVATATFLPRGSALFLYYNHDGGVKNNRNSGKPARLVSSLKVLSALLKIESH
jgi:hypothetical protein